MDKTDKLIQKILNEKLDIPEHFDKAIKNALYTEEGKKAVSEYKAYLVRRKYRLRKIVASAIISISSFSTICAAGFVYDRVWYEPKTYSVEEIKQVINSGVSEELKKSLISEENAKEIAINICSNLGYSDIEINSIKLNNDISTDNGAYYNITASSDKSDDIHINIDGKNGELNDFRDENFENLFHSNNIDNISNEEALIYSNNIIDCLNYNKEEYEFSDIKKETTYIKGVATDLWNAEYYKVYNGIINPYEYINLDFVVTNENFAIMQVSKISSGKFENDLINISQLDAISIASNKEKEFTNNKISEISVELGIRKMNNYIYMLENNLNFSNISLDLPYSEDISRKVWIVNVKNKNNMNNTTNNIDALKNSDKQYYIDCSTGNIIGGQLLYKGK